MLLWRKKFYGGFIKGVLRGVRCTKSLGVLFLHRRLPSWTTLVLYSRAVFIFNEPTFSLRNRFLCRQWRYRKCSQLESTRPATEPTTPRGTSRGRRSRERRRPETRPSYSAIYIRKNPSPDYMSQLCRCVYRCCYITVDSATTALQNDACKYRCISKQMHSKTPFSHSGYMKSLEFYDNYFTLVCVEKNLFDNIILTQNHAWHITHWLN